MKICVLNKTKLFLVDFSSEFSLHSIYLHLSPAVSKNTHLSQLYFRGNNGIICIPWRGKLNSEQKYQDTNVGVKIKNLLLLHFAVFHFYSEGNSTKNPIIKLKAILTNCSCKLFLGLERDIHTADIIFVRSYSAKGKRPS